MAHGETDCARKEEGEKKLPLNQTGLSSSRHYTLTLFGAVFRPPHLSYRPDSFRERRRRRSERSGQSGADQRGGDEPVRGEGSESPGIGRASLRGAELDWTATLAAPPTLFCSKKGGIF